MSGRASERVVRTAGFAGKGVFGLPIQIARFGRGHRCGQSDLFLQDALLESGRRRFRPVMLTSVTTVAALLPILAERNTQAQVIIPMAISIAFGLIVATIWILFLVPALFGIYARCLRRTADPA